MLKYAHAVPCLLAWSALRLDDQQHSDALRGEAASSWLLMQGVAYSAERDELVTCAVEKQAKVWDAERLGAPRLILSGHTGIVLQVLSCSRRWSRRRSGIPPPCFIACKVEQASMADFVRAWSRIQMEASRVSCMSAW